MVIMKHVLGWMKRTTFLENNLLYMIFL
jgi:hypothetical protein